MIPEGKTYATNSIEGLSQLLHEVFEVRGEPSVELNDGRGGSLVLTRELYDIVKDQTADEDMPRLSVKVLDALEAANKHTLGSRDIAEPVTIGESEFIRMVRDAKVKVVNIDAPPGIDINGVAFDIDGMTMVLSHLYPEKLTERLKPLTNELGAMIDPKGVKRAFRIIASGRISNGGSKQAGTKEKDIN